MNLLEHYIEEIISETKRKTQYGTDIVEVEMVIDCYGAKKHTTHMFLLNEWEQAKKNGYYMG